MSDTRLGARLSAWALVSVFLLFTQHSPPTASPRPGAPQPGAPQPAASGAELPHPILFVTQFPLGADFAARASVFGNHDPAMSSAGRGGDLWIQFPDGSRRNLTAEAGFGVASGFQGSTAIAVREPSVHWDGQKAIFSMVVGAPASQYQVIDFPWQLYEVTGLGPADTAVITKVPNQPITYNNISPVYGSDDRILFTSDRPRKGQAHLYPLLDEYEEVATVTGVWSLDPTTGDLALLDFSPSGDFSPMVDSFGRVLFSRWDHLQRDQQADADDTSPQDVYGTFDYADESADAAILPTRTEIFPEPRPSRTDLLAGTNLEGHRFNHFLIWQSHQDGRELETLNHIGRHELHGYFNRALNDDPNLREFIAAASDRFNDNVAHNLLQVAEDPAQPGRYLAIDAPEFQTQGSGQVIALSAPPGQAPDAIAITYLTHRDTQTVTPDGGTPTADHSGHYRDPLVLSDGRILASHTAETRAAGNDGTRAQPDPRYDYRLRFLAPATNGYLEAGQALTPGLPKNLSFWDPDVLVSYSGDLWELEAVEVRARPRPPLPQALIAAPEQAMFDQEEVEPAELRSYLEDRELALIISRDVTNRDGHDEQQPFNLSVPGGVATIGSSGTVYDVEYLQLFQADQVRGIGGADSPRPGRRVLARHLHDPQVRNPPNPSGPPASVAVAPDGSLAAFVPARRALSWQLTDGAGTPVVRERYWLTFQPGEIRTCASCHGLSSSDQTGGTTPTNSPQALAELLRFWKANLRPLFEDGFESGNTSAWSASVE
ncbi:MAG: hypothetical protein AAF604_24585 [Acidobacteriota bacterium]